MLDPKRSLSSGRGLAAPGRERPRRARSRSRTREIFRVEHLVAAGYVGILTIELHFPDAGSLKGKRSHVKSAKAQLQQRFGASVAEVEYHDLWQRSRLVFTSAAREMGELHELLDGADRWLHGQDWVVARIERRIVSLED